MKGEEITSAMDFKRHIEALHYLLQLWPGETREELTFNAVVAVEISSALTVAALCLYSSSVPTHRIPGDVQISMLLSSVTPETLTSNPLGQNWHPVLRMTLPQNKEEEAVVSRRGRGGLARLESPPPINRYAGDWSTCGRALLSGQEADYDEVAGSESDGGKHTCKTVCRT